MNQDSPLIHHTPGTGKAWSAVGDKYVVLAGGNETGGAYCLVETTVLPGGGPPLHHHTREEETFYILEGKVTFTINGRTSTGTPGVFVQVPRGTPHAFKNLSNAPARMLIHCLPAGFEHFLAEFGTALPSADAPPMPPSREEFEKLMAAAPRYGIVMAPKPAE